MPWRCPACEAVIQHADALPNPAVTYRCQVCRLELRVDPDTEKMVAIPLQDEKPPSAAKDPRRV